MIPNWGDERIFLGIPPFQNAFHPSSLERLYFFNQTFVMTLDQPRQYLDIFCIASITPVYVVCPGFGKTWSKISKFRFNYSHGEERVTSWKPGAESWSYPWESQEKQLVPLRWHQPWIWRRGCCSPCRRQTKSMRRLNLSQPTRTTLRCAYDGK